MKPNRLLFFLIILVMILSACKPGLPKPAEAAVPTSTAALAFTDTPAPSRTPESTQTPVPPTETPTPTLTPSPTTISTSDAWATAEPLLKDCDQVKSWGHSPGQQWIWSLCQPKSSTWVITEIVNEDDSSIRWKLSYKDWLPGETRAISASLYPFYWSQNGRFLYLTPWVRRGEAQMLSNGGGLMRLDLTTGKISRIIQGQLYDLFALSFSKDERYLAYMSQFASPLRLKILDNKTGDLSYLEMKGDYATGGSILWSDDNQRVVLTLGSDPNQGIEKYSVWLIDLAEETQDQIISDQTNLLDAYSWTDDSILLKDRWSGALWSFNTSTRQLKELPKQIP